VFALYPHADLDTDAGDLDFTPLASSGRTPRAFAGALGRALTHHPLLFARMLAVALRRPTRLQLHSLAKAVLLADALGWQRPPRVHAHFARASASTAMLVAAGLGVPFSFTAHALDIFHKPFDVPRKLRRADITVTVCEYNRRYIAEHWPSLGNVVVVPCGVDPDAFRRKQVYRRDPFTVAAVGRLVEKKGFADLIRACAILRDRSVDITCRVLGSGPEQSLLEGLVAEHRLEDVVRLEGSVPAAVVRAALESATVFCLPAIVAADGDRDSQPVVIKEAMAMELPVVGTDEVGIPEMVDDSTGRLVPPRDPIALADALEAMVKLDENELSAMGQRGRSRVEQRFALGDLVRRLADLLV